MKCPVHTVATEQEWLRTDLHNIKCRCSDLPPKAQRRERLERAAEKVVTVRRQGSFWQVRICGARISIWTSRELAEAGNNHAPVAIRLRRKLVDVWMEVL